MAQSKRKAFNVSDFVRSYGFPIILALVFLFYAVTTENFLTAGNLLNILHAAAPTVILASGLALVIMTGKLDISIGSIIFLTTAIGGTLMTQLGISPWIAIPLMVVIGALCGALNGFIVTVLRVNPFITTMGTMFILRGAALFVSEGLLVSIPDFLKKFGNAKIGPIFLDIIIAIIFLGLMYLMHTRTKFGRQVMAVGNGEQVAERLGVRSKRIVFITFLLSGLFATLGGILLMSQLGGVSLRMGLGMEFTGIAVAVIGGISLFGGEGSYKGLALGAVTLVVIENGLIHLGASPYIYPLVRGGIIFIAMYADSLKVRVQPKVRVETIEPVSAASD
jgi:ribose/xylose/arabinose/galactoside ABC-type transport system permease subunit